MPNFNKVILVGHLTRDPELRYLPSQTAVAEFGIATTRVWYDQSKQKKEETCFVDCQAFGKSAETLQKYTHKGDPLMVEGRLKFESWTAQDGSKRSKHRISIESFQLLSSKRGKATASQDEASGEVVIPPADGEIPF